MPAADPYDPTFLTKYGRVDSRTYFWRRFQEELERWLTPELLAYLEEAWPSPEQIEANRRAWAQQKRAQRNRMATAKAIADCARVDRARSASRPRTTTPTQLAIL